MTKLTETQLQTLRDIGNGTFEYTPSLAGVVDYLFRAGFWTWGDDTRILTAKGEKAVAPKTPRLTAAQRRLLERLNNYEVIIRHNAWNAWEDMQDQRVANNPMVDRLFDAGYLTIVDHQLRWFKVKKLVLTDAGRRALESEAQS